MEISNMPFCCTMAVIGMFGEHGEHSVVTKENINALINTKRKPVRDLENGEIVDQGKRVIIATSVDLKNIKILESAGFRVVDSYQGEQGEVFVLTRHLWEER